MSRRRAILSAILLAALSGATAVRAQDATAQRRPAAQTANQAGAAANAPAAPGTGDEPLQRLDPSTLAGGDYGGTEPGSLAGGDYGREPATAPDTAAPTPAISDPLAAPPAGRRRLLPRAPAPVGDPKDDAFEPVGVRAGAFTLRPSIETAGGYDNNPNREPVGGKGSKFYRLRGGFDANSDWSRHELDFHVDGQIRKYVDEPESGYEPNVSTTLGGRLDVTDRTKINAELRSSITTSKRGDPNTPTNLKGDEIQTSFGGTLGVSHDFNRFSLKLEGLADRYLFNDPKTQAGPRIHNGDREYNGYELRLRGGYELSPGLKPFAEVAVDRRDYDEKHSTDTDGQGNPVPGSGRRLGSSGYAIRTGAAFDLSGLVSGEAAVGYGRQTPRDKSLEAVDGLLFDGALEWRPTGLTTVRLNAKTAFQETTLAGAGGVLERAVGVAVEHRLRRNLIVTARADFDRQIYKGIGRVDDGITLALEGEYRLNRSVSLIGSFVHEKLNSSEKDDNYAASIIEFGLRFRR